MRKIYTLLAMIFIAGMVMGQEILELDCNYTETAIVVDGHGTDEATWEDVDAIDIAFGGDAPATVIEAWFKMMWDDTCLYFLIVRDDDSNCNEWCTGTSDWQSDRTEIMIDANHAQEHPDGWGASNSQGGKTGAERGHRQHLTLWSQTSNDTSWVADHWYHYTPYYYGYMIDASYSECEFGLIWAEEKDCLDLGFPAYDSSTFGLQIQLVDYDEAAPEDRTSNDLVDCNMWDVGTSADSAAFVTLVGSGMTQPSNVYTPSVTQAIKVYPTPAKEFLNIDVDVAGVEVRINNIIGQEVLRINNYNGEPVDLSGFATGLYYVSVYNNDILLGKNKFSVVK